MENEPKAIEAAAPEPRAVTSSVTVTATQDCNVLVDDKSVFLAEGDTAEMPLDEAAAYANLGLVEVGAGGKRSEGAAGNPLGAKVPRR